MNEPNNTNNGYVRSFPEDFNFDMPINLQAQSHAQNFLPSAFDNVDMTSMDIMNYENAGNYTANYVPYQVNPPASYFHPGNTDTMDGQLNITNHDQVENSSCPPPVSFQTLCGPSVSHSDTTNDGPADNNFQHLNNTCISYILIQVPTSNEYVVMREERTQSVLGRISAAASIGEMFALTECEKEIKDRLCIKSFLVLNKFFFVVEDITSI
ncbi:4937_t:CDS:1 [Paraglomus brasilianum]|uniref:4937_t:CDS:1 n=1 Tax=Paraglomus brasilianum TaxID=144538 RepID=A0A9N9GG11_9GLOM|nr:4937_t:CDS:1 [Paraglomus brasilianum]